jgi:hypothetical protein
MKAEEPEENSKQSSACVSVSTRAAAHAERDKPNLHALAVETRRASAGDACMRTCTSVDLPRISSSHRCERGCWGSGMFYASGRVRRRATKRGKGGRTYDAVGAMRFSSFEFPTSRASLASRHGIGVRMPDARLHPDANLERARAHAVLVQNRP